MGGNSILDKLDPLDWVIDNPWRKLNLDLSIGFSYMEYKKERKKRGLDPKIPSN